MTSNEQHRRENHVIAIVTNIQTMVNVLEPDTTDLTQETRPNVDCDIKNQIKQTKSVNVLNF